MQAHRRFYLVYVLSAGTTRTKSIPLNITQIYFNI